MSIQIRKPILCKVSWSSEYVIHQTINSKTYLGVGLIHSYDNLADRCKIYHVGNYKQSSDNTNTSQELFTFRHIPILSFLCIELIMYFEVVMKQIYLSCSLSLQLALSVFLWLCILFSRFTLCVCVCLSLSLSLSLSHSLSLLSIFLSFALLTTTFCMTSTRLYIDSIKRKKHTTNT